MHANKRENGKNSCKDAKVKRRTDIHRRSQRLRPELSRTVTKKYVASMSVDHTSHVSPSTPCPHLRLSAFIRGSCFSPFLIRVNSRPFAVTLHNPISPSDRVAMPPVSSLKAEPDRSVGVSLPRAKNRLLSPHRSSRGKFL
jgi:hypothetical protein